MIEGSLAEVLDRFKTVGVAGGQRELVCSGKPVIHDLLHQLPPILPLLLPRILFRLLLLSKFVNQHYTSLVLQPLGHPHLAFPLWTRNVPVEFLKLHVQIRVLDDRLWIIYGRNGLFEVETTRDAAENRSIVY